MAIDTLGANALASNSVTSAKIASVAVVNAKIGIGAVGTFNISDDAVTGAKIENNPTIAGNLGIGGTTTSTGAIVASAGVDFSATGDAAGMTSELLDDYEEGTWTANLIGSTGNPSTTISSTAATYTKVGRMVYARWEIGPANVSGASGGIRVNGLPYNNVGGHVSGNVMLYYRKAVVTDAVNITPYLSGNTVFFYYTRDGHIDVWGEVLYDLSGGAANFYMYASIVYETAS